MSVLTKNQWIGLVILLCLIFLFIGSFYLAERLTRPSYTDSDIMELDSLTLERIKFLENKNTSSYTYYTTDSITIRLQPFDPNTADSITLLELGFRPWMISNMNKYKAKGGKWRTKESVKRIWGMTDELYAQIEGYITIVKDTIFINEPDTFKFVARYPIKKDTTLNLNSCDTTDLKCLRGIGSGYAKMIVAYRTQLGGYVSTQQLYEIEYIPQATIDSIITHFIVSSDSIRTISVNHSSVKTLQSHPYISFTQAKAIYELRRNKFRLQSINQLQTLDCLTSEDIQRIEPYLSFEE